MKKLELSGKKFGMLTAIKNVYIGKKLGWRCECSCGEIIDIPTSELSSGQATNCGCIRKALRDHTGEQHGDLTITGLHSIRGRSKVWSYRCSCGNIGEKLYRNITRHPHCGCKTISGEVNGNEEQVMINNILSNYKGNATTRGLDFKLTKEDFTKLILSECYYCGEKPSKIVELRGIKLSWNGIDRLDSSKGYLKGNVEACCADCNYFKNKRSKEEFLDKIVKIYKNLEEK